MVVSLILGNPALANNSSSLFPNIDTIISHTEAQIYHQSPSFSYELSLIVLAMEKTTKEYGTFALNTVDPEMTHLRLIEEMKKNTTPNLIRSLAYSQAHEKEGLSYIPFPIYLGLFGFRTCFTSKEIAPKIDKIKTLADLKQYQQGIGVGWAEKEIYQHNGIPFYSASSIKSIFKMTEKGRVDLFCRGASELRLNMVESDYLDNLTYNKTFAIYYPLPIFLYTNSENKDFIARVNAGLKIAYADGSLRRLWEQHFSPGFAFQNLGSRTIIKLENPSVKTINFDYEQYFYGRDYLDTPPKKDL